MDYFKHFPNRTYNGEGVVDILACVLPSRLNIDNTFIWQRHRIGEGETAVSLAYKLYGDGRLYWIILVVNNIVDPFLEWPVGSDIFEDFVRLKYPDINDVHHFFDNRSQLECDDVMDKKFRNMPREDLPFYIIPVTNLEHERALNDKKRNIVVVNPLYLNEFIETYNKAIEGKL